MAAALHRTGVLIVACAVLGAIVANSALAEAPLEKVRTALERTAQAKTAKIAVTQRFTAADRMLETRVAGAVAAGDSDLVVEGEGGKTRRVAVGTTVYERRPDAPGVPWRQTTRPQPTQTTAFGELRLPDGTHVGDPKLYRAVLYRGSEALPQGAAEKLVLELDMAAVAAALKLTGADAARLQQMRGTLTLWIGESDGRVLRNRLALVIPGDAGPRTLETTIDFAALDAPLEIGAP